MSTDALDCYDFYLFTIGERYFPDSAIPEWIPLLTNERIYNEL